VHLAIDTNNNHPRTDLYASMLQRLGMKEGSFSSGADEFATAAAVSYLHFDHLI